MSILNKLFQEDKEVVEKKSTEKKDTAKVLKKKKVAPAKTETKEKGKVSVDPKGVLLRPLITEKSSLLQATVNTYAFAVRKDANKFMIKEAIAAAYGVTPTSVSVVHVRGKKRTRGRRVGTTPNWKKAMVILPAGKTITVVEGV